MLKRIEDSDLNFLSFLVLNIKINAIIPFKHQTEDLLVASNEIFPSFLNSISLKVKTNAGILSIKRK